MNPEGEAKPAAHIDVAALDSMIASVEHRLERQLDEILHHAAFKQLECMWRALWFVVERAHKPHVEVALLQCSKKEAISDMMGAEAPIQSGIYMLCNRERRRGSSPVGTLTAAFEIGCDESDLQLLEQIADVAGELSAQFVANVGPAFFGLRCWDAAPNVGQLPALLEGACYDDFRAFRAGDAARSITLCLPRFAIARCSVSLPRSDDGLLFCRRNQGDKRCFVPASFALAARIAESYARHGWCANISGIPFGVVPLPCGDAVTDAGGDEGTVLELALPDYIAGELSQHGLTPMVGSSSDRQLCFRYESTLRTGADDDEAEAEERMKSTLSYQLITGQVARIAWLHIRDNAHSWQDAMAVERGLSAQMSPLGHDASIPTQDSMFRHPLRALGIMVEPATDGAYQVFLRWRPFLLPEHGQFVHEPLDPSAAFRSSFPYRRA